MKIKDHPSPSNMVDVKDQDTKIGTKVLTSEGPNDQESWIPKCRYRVTDSKVKADTSKKKVPRGHADP